MKTENEPTWTVAIPEKWRGKKDFIGAVVPEYYVKFMEEVGKGEYGFQSKAAFINHLLREEVRRYEQKEKRKI